MSAGLYESSQGSRKHSDQSLPPLSDYISVITVGRMVTPAWLHLLSLCGDLLDLAQLIPVLPLLCKRALVCFCRCWFVFPHWSSDLPRLLASHRARETDTSSSPGHFQTFGRATLLVVVVVVVAYMCMWTPTHQWYIPVGAASHCQLRGNFDNMFWFAAAVLWVWFDELLAE